MSSSSAMNSAAAGLLRDPSAWHRVGRGKGRQFFCTDEEIRDFLERGLSPDAAPYRLMAAEMTEADSTFTNRLATCPILEVIACCERGGGHISWIASEALTPLQGWTGANLVSVAAVNGLILVEHGFRHRGRRETSRIAIVDTVQHVTTGKQQTNTDYVRLFKLLDRTIRPALTWSTVRSLRDGTEFEDERTELMTDAAAEQASREPKSWAVRPGRRVKGSPA